MPGGCSSASRERPCPCEDRALHRPSCQPQALAEGPKVVQRHAAAACQCPRPPRLQLLQTAVRVCHRQFHFRLSVRWWPAGLGRRPQIQAGARPLPTPSLSSTRLNDCAGNSSTIVDAGWILFICMLLSSSVLRLWHCTKAVCQPFPWGGRSVAGGTGLLASPRHHGREDPGCGRLACMQKRSTPQQDRNMPCSHTLCSDFRDMDASRD